MILSHGFHCPTKVSSYSNKTCLVFNLLKAYLDWKPIDEYPNIFYLEIAILNAKLFRVIRALTQYNWPFNPLVFHNSRHVLFEQQNYRL